VFVLGNLANVALGMDSHVSSLIFKYKITKIIYNFLYKENLLVDGELFWADPGPE
jgi:hypothetical protein